DGFDMTARCHDVINRDRVEIEEIGQHRTMLASEIVCFQNQAANLLLRQHRFSAPRWLKAQRLEQGFDEQIDEPDDRTRELKHRREDVTYQRRETVGMGRAHHLGRNLREYEQRE